MSDDVIRRGLYKRSFRYLRPYLKHQVAILGVMIGTTLLSLPQPIAVKFLIDNVLVAKDVSLLYLLVGALMASFGFHALLSWYLSYLSSLVHQRITVDVRCNLYDHVHRLGPEFYNNTQTGDITLRVLSDCVIVSSLVATTLSKIVTDVLTLVAVLALMFYFDWKLSLISLTTLPLFVLVLVKFNSRIRDANSEVMSRSSHMSAVLIEAVSMLKLTQIFSKEPFMSDRFRGRVQSLADSSVSAAMTTTRVSLMAGFFVFVGPLVVLCYGGLQVIDGAISIGTLVAFYSYLAQLYGPVGNLAGVNNEVQGAFASLWRVFDFLDRRPGVEEAINPVFPAAVLGGIEFRDVDFSYPERAGVLKGLTFKIAPGEKVGFVGQSGAGKTTIVDLLCRFYDPDQGAILLDDCDIRHLTLKTLRNQIAIVSQDTLLFDDTIYENIAFGCDNPAPDAVEEAARVANIHSFIANLPDGYKTIVGERGVRLSGGQRQRISIARAVLRNAAVIILDEATSSVDSIRERMIQEELNNLIEGKTAIIIAHRFSTMHGVDRIFVLENGEITAAGSHDDLLASSLLYREMFTHQSYEVSGAGESYTDLGVPSEQRF